MAAALWTHSASFELLDGKARASVLAPCMVHQAIRALACTQVWVWHGGRHDFANCVSACVDTGSTCPPLLARTCWLSLCAPMLMLIDVPGPTALMNPPTHQSCPPCQICSICFAQMYRWSWGPVCPAEPCWQRGCHLLPRPPAVMVVAAAGPMPSDSYPNRDANSHRSSARLHPHRATC